MEQDLRRWVPRARNTVLHDRFARDVVVVVREPEHQRPVEAGRRVVETKPEDLVREAAREGNRWLGVGNLRAELTREHFE